MPWPPLTIESTLETVKYGRVTLDKLEVGQEYWATYKIGPDIVRHRFRVTGRYADGVHLVWVNPDGTEQPGWDYVDADYLTVHAVYYELKYWYTADSVPMPSPERARRVTQLEVE